MWDLRAALEVSQTALGAVSCLYFAVGIQFKQAEARRRERTPFICFLIVMLFTVLVEQGILIVSAGGIPDLPPLAAAILYTLALILQIDHLCPCTAEDTNREPAWHVYFGSWAAMFVFDIVAIIKLALTARSLTLDLVCTSVAIGVRWCLGLALFATRLDRGGHIRLPDDVEYGTMGTDNSNDQGGGSSEPTKQSALRQSVRKEVDAAGGIWPWVKRFQIFLPWIWPSSAPRIKLRILTSLGLVLTTTGLELVMPRLYSVFVESLAQVYKDKDFSLIWPPLLVYTVTQSLLAGLSTLRSLVWSKVKIDRRRLASTSIHAHVMRHDARFHNQTNSTDINTAIDNGVIVCETFDFLVLQVVPQIITVIVAGTTIFSLFGPHVALVQASVIALDMIVVSRSTRVQMPIQDAKMIAHQEMKRRREGALKAWTTVALYGQIDREIDDFTTILQTETGLELKHLISWYGFQFSTSTMFTVGCFSATALAILYGLQAGGTFGPVVMFTNYWALLQTPLKFFTRIPGRLFQDLSTADRLRRLLADKPTMRYGTAAPRPVRDSIMLKNVSFSYPDSGKPIFKDLTLRILPKTTTAIVGPSAAGKTTIFNLLARQFDPDEGSIEVDHQDIRALQRGALPELMTVMPQKPDILDGTIRSNITFGRDSATDADVHAAARTACIHDEIMKMPGQYNTMVGEGGSKLSGGQIQRIALARAVLPGRSTLLLDEPTSAVDTVTEDQLKENLKKLRKTTVLIAHRLSSVRHANQIIVLGKRKDDCTVIVEKGTHEELVEKNGVYARMWRKATGKETIEQMLDSDE